MRKFFLASGGAIIGLLLVAWLWALSVAGGPWFDDALAEDLEVAFVSVSDGVEKAEIAVGFGKNKEDAEKDAWDNLEWDRFDEDEWQWKKVDRVVNLTKKVGRVENAIGNYQEGLVGLAFDGNEPSERLALLPEEVMIYGLEESLNPERFYAFETESNFELRDENEEMVNTWPVYRGHRLFLSGEDVDFAAVKEMVVEAGRYLIRVVDDRGRFIYDYDSIAGEPNSSYNMLRHAGTTYSMLELYQYGYIYDEEFKKELLAAAERALNYLERQIEDCNFVETPGRDAKCLLDKGNVKIGGNGLAILAFVEYQKATGDDRYLELAGQLAEWILEVQQPDGRFSPHKLDNESGVPDDFVSEYYPGEAIYGLSALYQLLPDERFLDAAEANARYLIEVRDAGLATDQLIHDHWLLYGLNELYRKRGEFLYLEHVSRIVEAILTSQHGGQTLESIAAWDDEARLDWRGGWYEPPRSTPVATRLEGLGAALELMDYVVNEGRFDIFTPSESNDVVTKVFYSFYSGVSFSAGTQFGPELAMYFSDPQFILGAFHESLTQFDVRIDYVQHNISALLFWLEMGE